MNKSREKIPEKCKINDMCFTSDQCARGVERKRRRVVEADLREISERAFEAYEELL